MIWKTTLNEWRKSFYMAMEYPAILILTLLSAALVGELVPMFTHM